MRRLYVLLTCLCFIAALVAAQASLSAQATERVVAIGDVHGDLDAFTDLLRKCGLIDEARHWSGGKATLVQTGDLIDRGPKSHAVLDFVMALQKEAQRANGAVRVGLGNHEVMNIIGDLNYVTAEDYASFADAKSEQRRRSALQDYSRLQMERGIAVNQMAWLEAHPLGFVEHRQAFGPDGVYGRWLRTLPAVQQIGDSLFLHGGISPEFADWTVDKINAQIRTEIQAFDRIKQSLVEKKLGLPFSTVNELLQSAQQELAARKAKPPAADDEEGRQYVRVLEQFSGIAGWMITRDNGPLWFRGYDKWTDEEGQPNLDRLTQAFRVKRIVVGHTVQAKAEVRPRFSGKAILIDTGMLASYFKGGRASALEITGDRIRAIYTAGAVELN